MNIEQMKELAQRAAKHAALADVMRLAVVDELAVGDKSPGELQATLGLSSNLLSHHLNVLVEAGFVVRRRSEGDRRRTYLTLGDHTALESVAAPIDAARVLFVCTANSARSQLAAALWSQTTDVPVASAGTQPAQHVAPGAAAVAERHHLRLLSSTPQPFAQVTRDRDLVVAVCDNAYEELGDVIDIHWAVPDPVRIDTAASFETVYGELSRRVSSLAPLLAAQ